MNLLIAIGIIFPVISSAPYIRDILRGETKPHIVTFGVWTVSVVIALNAQLYDHAGPAVLITLSDLIATAVIFILAIRFGTRDITRFDFVCLGGAIIALLLWVTASTPLFALYMAVLIDFVGFLPTYRKTWKAPRSETLFTYWMSTVRSGITVMVVANLTILNALHPASLFVTESVFIAMVLFRRAQLKVATAHEWNGSPLSRG